MKSKSIGSLILLAVLAPSCGSGGGSNPKVPPTPLTPRWTNQFRIPTTVNLRAAFFNDVSRGIVAGEAGTFLLTQDGGMTWKPIEVDSPNRNGDILAISAAGRSVVAVGIDSGNAGARYWWTDDTQTVHTEDVVGFDSPNVYTDVSVVSGLIEGFNRTSLHLRSNGILDYYDPFKSATQFDTALNFPNPPATWLRANGMYIAPGGIAGFVVGSKAGPFGQIRYQPSNISGIWKDGTLPASTPPLNSIQMLGPLGGFCCGDAGTVLQTQDGIAWTVLPNAPGGLGTTTFRAIRFWDFNNGYVVGDNGTNGVIYKLTFAASAWTWSAPVLAPQKLYGLSLASATTVYAVGDNGLVFKTIDGTTWNDIRTPQPVVSPQINAVSFNAGGSVGIAAGSAGAVLRTLDGGTTWTSFAGGIPGGFDVKGVCIPKGGSGSVAYLCGTNAIYKNTTLTSGAPSNWVLQTAAGSLESILFSSGDLNGVCVGGATVLYTVDGATWIAPATAPGGAGYHALAFDPTGNTVYAAGDGGAVSSTVDDAATVGTLDIGKDWTDLTAVPGTPTLRSIQAPSGTNFKLFVGADDGNVYRLPTGSTTWGSQLILAASPVVALAFGDDLNGLAVVQGTTPGVFYTIDGSSTAWTVSALHVKLSGSNLLRAAWMNPAKTGYVAGDNGLILKTTTGGK